MFETREHLAVLGQFLPRRNDKLPIRVKLTVRGEVEESTALAWLNERQGNLGVMRREIHVLCGWHVPCPAPPNGGADQRRPRSAVRLHRLVEQPIVPPLALMALSCLGTAQGSPAGWCTERAEQRSPVVPHRGRIGGPSAGHVFMCVRERPRRPGHGQHPAIAPLCSCL